MNYYYLLTPFVWYGCGWLAVLIFKLELSLKKIDLSKSSKSYYYNKVYNWGCFALILSIYNICKTVAKL